MKMNNEIRKCCPQTLDTSVDILDNNMIKSIVDPNIIDTEDKKVVSSHDPIKPLGRQTSATSVVQIDDLDSMINDYKKVFKERLFKEQVNKVKTSAEYLTGIVKDENHPLHNWLLEDLRKESYLVTKSVSIYVVDSKDRVLLHRNRISKPYIPDSAHITPIIGFCDSSDSHLVTARKVIEENIGVSVQTGKLVPIWGDCNNMHVAYCYFVSDSFENFEKEFTNPLIGGEFPKYKKTNFESKLYPSVYYCSYGDVTGLDSRYHHKNSKGTNEWLWTLHRPNGCTAVYNAFQWMVRRKRELASSNANKYSESIYEKKRIDVDISSLQSIIWSILKKGFFENKLFHLGKIGVNLDYCIQHKLHKYVPSNSIPLFEKQSNDKKVQYTSNEEYDRTLDQDFINSLKQSRRNMANRYLENIKNLQIVVIDRR